MPPGSTPGGIGVSQAKSPQRSTIWCIVNAGLSSSRRHTRRSPISRRLPLNAARTLTRSAAVLGAATALSVAGAGAAMATTHSNTVDGNTVSVTFELDGGFVDGDTCGAVLVPTSAAPGIAAALQGGDLGATLETLMNDDNVTVLTTDLGLPAVVLGGIGGIGLTSGTVSAEDVPSNVYALVSHCASDDEPTIAVPLLVGNPMDAIMGSIEMGSANGGLDTASALLGGAGGDEGALSSEGLGGLLGGATGSDAPTTLPE